MNRARVRMSWCAASTTAEERSGRKSSSPWAAARSSIASTRSAFANTSVALRAAHHRRARAEHPQGHDPKSTLHHKFLRVSYGGASRRATPTESSSHRFAARSLGASSTPRISPQRRLGAEATRVVYARRRLVAGAPCGPLTGPRLATRGRTDPRRRALSRPPSMEFQDCSARTRRRVCVDHRRAVLTKQRGRAERAGRRRSRRWRGEPRRGRRRSRA